MRALFSSFILLLSALAVCAAPIGFNEPTISGLVGWWTMNEGSGTQTKDFSGFANTGSLSNSPAWTNGVVGRGLYFGAAGVSNCVVTTSTNSQGNTFSAAAWANTAVNGHANIRNIVGKGYKSSSSITAPYSSFGLGLNASFQFQWQIASTTTGYTAVSPLAYTSNVWYHVAGTYDGAQAILYINGSPVQTNTVSITVGWDNERVYIGTYLPTYLLLPASANTVQWIGPIDDVRLYSRTLTAAEVKQLYNGGYGSQH